MKRQLPRGDRPSRRDLLFASLGRVPALLAGGSLLARLVRADEPATGAGAPLAGASSDALRKLVTQLALEHLPHTFEDQKKWNLTRQVVSGLDIKREGLKLKTHRRYRTVNDGTWKRYVVKLIDPERQFSLAIENAVNNGDGRARFDLVATAALDIYAQLAQWERGIRLLSISTEADAVVRLRLTCLAGVSLDTRQFPPDLVIRPTVTAADLELLDFTARRISKLDGPVVEELGRGARKVIQEKLDDREPRLVEKINARLVRDQEKLRVSLSEVLDSPWADIAKLLPARK